MNTANHANKRMGRIEGISSGISIRESQVREWLRRKKYKGEYLLVSTKPDSEWSEKLKTLLKQKFLIVDLYAPVLLEKALTFRAWSPMDWMIRKKQRIMVREFLKRGNHFLVANRQQREYWVEESGRLGAVLRHKDISVFPTGSSLTINPVRRRFATGDAGGHQSLTMNNRKVVLWFGGIYPWTDPEPLIHAFGALKVNYPDWKLRILGGFHPDTGYECHYRRLIELARRRIGDKQVEVVEWQPQNAVKRFLDDIAFAVHLTKATREDYCAHRVRLLTLLNAEIGVITSGRDTISDFLVKMRAGVRISTILNIKRLLEKAMHEPGLRTRWRSHAPAVESAYLKKEIDIRL